MFVVLSHFSVIMYANQAYENILSKFLGEFSSKYSFNKVNINMERQQHE